MTPAPRPRRGTLRLGSIKGVVIEARASWLLFAGLLAFVIAPSVQIVMPGLGWWAYPVGFAFAMLLYATILLHEIAHALAALRYGLPVGSITLEFIGGLTELRGAPRTAGQEFVIAVVGPVTSIVVGIAALVAQGWFAPGLLRFGLLSLAWANLVLGILNLAPGLPLDGGRILRAAVWAITGRQHLGTIVAAWVGRVLAVLVIAWPLVAIALLDRRLGTVQVVVAVVIGAYLWAGASASLTSARVRDRMPSLRGRELARRVILVDGALSVAAAVAEAGRLGAGGIVVHDDEGTPTGLVSGAAVAAVPDASRADVMIGELARRLGSGVLLAADIGGEDLVRAMAAAPADEYLLVESDGSAVGVLLTADVDRAFNERMGRR